MIRASGAAALAVAGVVWLVSVLGAHSGPPFPIVTDRRVGAYEISIWTDPDATDDGSAGGQFWVVLSAPNAATAIPRDTRVTVSIRPLDRPGVERSTPATPVNGNPSRHFASVLMDHEGEFAVRAMIEGPLGSATLASRVVATYDLRPPPLMLAVYLLPFLLMGALWMKLLLRRRKHRLSS